MARAGQVVVLALVLFAVVGLAYGADTPQSGSDDTDVNDYDPNFIGTSNDDDNDGATSAKAASPSESRVVAGPIGGPVPPNAFAAAKTTENPDSPSSATRVSAVAGAATAALVGVFFF